MLSRAESACVVTFYTTAGAMAMEKLAASRGIPGRLIPAPRALTSDCGIAWRSDAEWELALRQAAKEARLAVAGYHLIEC